MDVAGFNVIDLIVVAVILLSGIFALARGFVKEIMSIVSWVGAVFAWTRAALFSGMLHVRRVWSGSDAMCPREISGE